MDAIECIKTRRSIRKYSDQPISHETVQEIMEATIMAPSWKNTQSVRYTFVEDREKIETIADSAVLGFEFNTKTMKRSAMLAVQTVVSGLSGREEDGTVTTAKGDTWQMFDGGISAQTFCLAAHALGVATVIMGIVDDTLIRETLGLPENETVTCVIAMGYPIAPQKTPPRHPAGEMMRYI